MVESSNHCVLKWADHAGYVAERFNGLLARQALVDVTLICEEQKLRVHKLVLASNSTYFEEILQQDLGQDPIILLRDLNFEVLKAMVEFMYCGETTISHENLPSLLTASRIFKIKELAYIIDTVMETQNYNNAIESVGQLYKTDNELNHKNNNYKINGRNDLIDTKHNIDNTFKHILYEDSYDTESNNLQQTFKDYLLMEDIKEKIHDESFKPLLCEKTKENLEGRIKMNNIKKNDEILEKVKEVQPLLYEQCCDVIDLNIPEKYSTISSKTHANDEMKLDVAQNFIDSTNDKVGKCIKVYTHKKRKPVINIKNELTQLNDLVSKLSPTNSIDLSDTPSNNNIPVTLLTPLDMECAEYLFSLDNENMQLVAEGLINEQRSLMKCKDINGRVLNVNKNNLDKKDDFDFKAINDKVQRDMEKPVLRRSVRLNQQDCEDITNNGISIQQQTVIDDKLLEKTNFPNKMESFGKGKRRIKENNRKVTDQNVINIGRCNKKCFNNNLRAQRNHSKTVVKKNINNNKSDQKSKGNNRLKCEMTTDDINRLKISMGTSPIKRNAVGYISRALWGDMSDIIERNNDIMDLSDYSPDGEIPFAVGLLPLRTALEKMQAMTDYQPRKTRSSVAPNKQEINHFKRKTSTLDSNVLAKKQNVGSIVQDNNKTNTVCHIQIRAAPSSHYIKNRKKFLNEHVTTLGSPTIVNRQ
ncbi:protein PF3D7_1417600-like isoform X1 [Vespa velutina]|uniref:protein PF3D7_1417600-like isoform X1 n=2 Tax=Vespa velutina TaxID=202808 RepID=UPI001FB34E6B|nr:protein PF3D7_1417600-like isoform X1 [Vespa velutina]